jgi:hypothetical protein
MGRYTRGRVVPGALVLQVVHVRGGGPEGGGLGPPGLADKGK